MKDGSITVAASNPEDTIAYMISVSAVSDEVLRTKMTKQILSMMKCVELLIT